MFAAPGSAPECLEGDRVDGSLVVAAEPLRVELVGLRPVGGVQVEADLGSERMVREKAATEIWLTQGMMTRVFLGITNESPGMG